MAKKFDNCILCNSKKFLNYADLCKECMRRKESIPIRENILAKKLKLSKAMKEETRKEEETKKSMPEPIVEEGTADKPEEESKEDKKVSSKS